MIEPFALDCRQKRGTPSPRLETGTRGWDSYPPCLICFIRTHHKNMFFNAVFVQGRSQQKVPPGLSDLQKFYNQNMAECRGLQGAF